MAKKIRVWDGTAWQDVSVALPYDSLDYIQNTLVDAKGDIVTASANDVPAILSKGADGTILVSDSTTSTGLAWQPYAAQQAGGKNAIINGAFDFWQRGTTFTVGAAFPYTADRWQVIRGGVVDGMTVTRQATADTTNLPFIQYGARVQRDSGNTSTQYLEIVQSFESNQSIPFAGKTVTFSFYARKGANFSATSDILNYRLATGTGTDQNLVTAGYTGQVQLINANATLTTTWQRFQATTTIQSTATEIGLRFRYTPTGTASTNDYFEITGAQLELGPIATPFARNAPSIQGELAACQRYYWRSTPGSAYSTHANGMASSSTTSYSHMHFPVPMRISPTSVDFANVGFGDFQVGVLSPNFVGLTIHTGTYGIVVQVNASGYTQYRPGHIMNNNNAAGYLGFNAEL